MRAEIGGSRVKKYRVGLVPVAEVILSPIFKVLAYAAKHRVQHQQSGLKFTLQGKFEPSHYAMHPRSRSADGLKLVDYRTALILLHHLRDDGTKDKGGDETKIALHHPGNMHHWKSIRCLGFEPNLEQLVRGL